MCLHDGLKSDTIKLLAWKPTAEPLHMLPAQSSPVWVSTGEQLQGFSFGEAPASRGP
jgi:hypothetical protein